MSYDEVTFVMQEKIVPYIKQGEHIFFAFIKSPGVEKLTLTLYKSDFFRPES